MACFFLFATLSPLSTCQFTVWLASFFLPQFHHCPLVSPHCLSFLVPPGWLNDGFLSWIYCVGWLVSLQLWLTPLSELPYLNGYWGFYLGSIPGFCRLRTMGRWLLPCDARVSAHVHGTSFGDTSARSIVLSVSPCCVPRCVGLAVDTGVKRTSLSTASSAHPCWLVPCWSHRLDRALKSPHIVIVSPSLSSISSRKSQPAPVMQVEGWMYALMGIRDLCLVRFF